MFKIGQQVTAFHPHMLGVVKPGTIVGKNKLGFYRVEFGPMLGGIYTIPEKDIVVDK